MKKIFSAFLAATALIGCMTVAAWADESKASAVTEGGSAPVTTTHDSSEDDFFTEETKTIKVNTDVSDYLEDYSKSFVYKFTIDAPGKVQINFRHEMITSESFYWTVGLYNSDCSSFITTGAKGEYSIRGNKMSVNLPATGLAKGTYCVLVTCYDPTNKDYKRNHTDNEYTLRVNYTKSSIWETENNDTVKTADPIVVNKEYYGANYVSGDVDYFKFTIDAPGKVQILFKHDTEDDSNYCWSLRLFKQDGATNAFIQDVPAYFTGSDDGGYCPAAGLKAGTYYLMITKADSHWSNETYHFKVNYTKSAVWEMEDNDTKATARTIATNQNYFGSIYGRYDNDWYKFTIPTTNKITVSFSHPDIETRDTYWIVYLIKSDGVTTLDNWGVQGNEPLVFEKTMSGTYYLKITSRRPDDQYWNNTSTVTYTLRVNDIPAVPSSVKAASASVSSIKVSWEKVNAATGYEVWRSESSNGTFKKVGTTTATAYTNGSLTSGKKYFYKVRSYKTVNGKTAYSDYSEVVSASTALTAPSKVSAKATSASTISVSWKSPAGASIIEVWRTNKANAEQKDYVCIGRYMAKDSSCVSKQLLSGTTYYYKVRAYTILSNGSKVYTSYSSVVSAKTQGETASKGAVDFATRLYTKCLGRQPEADGLNYWSVALTKHEKTGAEAAKLFFQSAEFKNFKTSNKEYVTRLYRTFMGREPETDGLNYWVGELGKGTSRDSVLASFASSQEFTNICKQYGIERGTI